MILKVAAPFRLPEFGLRTDRIAETPDRYAEAWKEVRDAWQARDVLALDPSASEPRSSVSAVRFSHATHGRPPGQSRYRTISDHDLERPIHFLELELSAHPAGISEKEADIIRIDRSEAHLTADHVEVAPPVQIIAEWNRSGYQVRHPVQEVHGVRLDRPTPVQHVFERPEILEQLLDLERE